MSVNKKDVKVGQKVKVTITTSSDVDYVTVNGKVVAQKKNVNGSRIWTLQLVGEKAGPMNVSVVCYNDEGVASETVTTHINVRRK